MKTSVLLVLTLLYSSSIVAQTKFVTEESYREVELGMTLEETEGFARTEYAEDAVRLRRWDDAAKDTEAAPPSLSHFAPFLRRVALPQSES